MQVPLCFSLFYSFIPRISCYSLSILEVKIFRVKFPSYLSKLILALPSPPGIRININVLERQASHAKFSQIWNSIELWKCNALLTWLFNAQQTSFLGLISHILFWFFCRRDDYLQHQLSSEKCTVSRGHLRSSLHLVIMSQKIYRVGSYILQMPIYLDSNHRYFISWQKKKSLSRCTTSKSGTLTCNFRCHQGHTAGGK